MSHPERACTRCVLEMGHMRPRGPRTVATVVCTARDGLQWFACDKPEHQREYDDPTTPTRTTPIAEWFLGVTEERSR